MKKALFLSIIVVLIGALEFFSCKPKVAPEKAIAQTLVQQVDSFNEVKGRLLASIQNNSADEKQLQQQFIELRLAYKKFEWAAEYFLPNVTLRVNGPPVEELEVGANVLKPSGLQVIESYLFPKYNSSKKSLLIAELNGLRPNADKFSMRFGDIALLDWQVFDATKLEVFRVITLGIAGFDDPLSQKSMQEAATSMQSIREAIGYYTDKEDKESLAKKFDLAIQYLNQHTDFNSFDRAAFILNYCNPITRDISELEKRQKIKVTRYNRLLNQDAETMFDTDAINVNAYAPDQWYFSTKEKVALGKKLFADPVLSGTGTRSCQSCHKPEMAFTDGMVTNMVLASDKHLPRNTPTLLNTALQPAQFYDLRARTLEDQSNVVIHNPAEMHGSLQKAVQRLWQDSTYKQMFAAAYPKPNRKSIDTTEVENALASYIRSLTLLNSRFDDYMRGDKTAMNQEEVKGFNLFMGKGKCGTCHYLPLFNGVTPPMYSKIETEVIGVPQDLNQKTIDSDMGRYAVMPAVSLQHAFKIATVRNAARTAPYMHNGVYTTLEQVMDFYNKGGGAGLGFAVSNQTLQADKLNLTNKESAEIIAFIKTLDSKY